MRWMVVLASVLLDAAGCGRISFEPIGSPAGDANTAADGHDGPGAGACAPQRINRGCMVGSGTTVSAPFVMQVTAGDLLVIAVDYDGTGGQMTVADTAGNAYTAAGVIARSTSQSSQVWFARAATSSSLTVTATFTVSSGQAGVHLHEYTEAMEVGMTMSTAGNGSSAVTPTIVTSDAQGMGFAYAVTTAVVSTVALPYNIRETCNGNMTADASIAAGSQTATFTLTSSAEWIATIVELRCP